MEQAPGDILTGAGRRLTRRTQQIRGGRRLGMRPRQRTLMMWPGRAYDQGAGTMWTLDGCHAAAKQRVVSNNEYRTRSGPGPPTHLIRGLCGCAGGRGLSVSGLVGRVYANAVCGSTMLSV